MDTTFRASGFFIIASMGRARTRHEGFVLNSWAHQAKTRSQRSTRASSCSELVTISMSRWALGTPNTPLSLCSSRIMPSSNRPWVHLRNSLQVMKRRPVERGTAGGQCSAVLGTRTSPPSLPSITTCRPSVITACRLICRPGGFSRKHRLNAETAPGDTGPRRR